MSSRFMRAGGSPARTGVAFKAASPAISGAPLIRSPVTPSSGIADATRRSDDVDRPFFLWLLASLIAATFVTGAIALSSVVTILPSGP
jgi:hypothetical protein